MLNKRQKILKLTEDLLNGIPASQRPPIYLVGLPRSGTTWIGAVLNTSPGVKYFFEPFNFRYIPEAKPHFRKYLRGDDRNEEFAQYCRDAFAGRTDDLLGTSTQKKSKSPFETNRVSAREPDKWKSRLEPWQIEEIKRFVQPFEIPFYPTF